MSLKVPQPDRDLFDIVKRIQSGDDVACWEFINHRKICAIIKGRINQYAKMFSWLPFDQLQDVEIGLIPRLIEVVKTFKLPVQPNDGRIVSYFNVRIKGEADFLLKKVTGMRQVNDETTGKSFLKLFGRSLEDFDDVFQSKQSVSDDVMDLLDSQRQVHVLEEFFSNIDNKSNDATWLKCYEMRLDGSTWPQVTVAVGYKPTDQNWVKENVTRFVSRTKHKLIMSGEEIDYRICGIYSDSSSVAISVLDSHNRKNDIIWSKDYDNFNDLIKVESKVGDLLRQYDITYFVMNEQTLESRAYVILMRYLTTRESFVEVVNINHFKTLLQKMPDYVNKIHVSDQHRIAILLTHIKRGHILATRHQTNAHSNR